MIKKILVAKLLREKRGECGRQEKRLDNLFFWGHFSTIEQIGVIEKFSRKKYGFDKTE